MRLINKSPYALDLQAVPAATEDDPHPAPVKAFVPSVAKGADGSLVHSGATVVPDADWEVLKKHAGVKRYQRLGFLVAAPDRASGGASVASEPTEVRPPKDDLTGFSAAEAVEYAATVDSLEEVHSLLEVEDRKTVKAALERRLKELSN